MPRNEFIDSTLVQRADDMLTAIRTHVAQRGRDQCCELEIVADKYSEARGNVAGVRVAKEATCDVGSVRLFFKPGDLVVIAKGD